MQDFEQASYGYWLVFRNLEDLNRTWCALREEVVSGSLGATGATCSTLRYDPSKCGAGPHTTGRIRILTECENYLDIGMKLIKLNEVQHNLKYKTIQSSNSGMFSHIRKNPGRISLTTLLWNDGQPSTTQEHVSETGVPNLRHKKYFPLSEDIWKLNIACGLSEYSMDAIHGRWIVPFDYANFDLTYYWHKLKFLLEKGKIPASKMECVGTTTRLDQPTIHVFTTKNEVMRVGELLLPVVKRNISYVINDHFLTWTRPVERLEDSNSESV